jgi:hypothetical protein
MKKLHAFAAFMLLVAGTASAGESGIINQAGPYEAQMRFYLHPAHGFPGTAEAAAQSASAVDPKGPAGGELTDERHAASTPAVRAHPARHRSNRVAAAERS